MYKISIIGCGSVGATTAYALLLKGIASELALVDAQKGRAEGIMLDLEHSLSFTYFAKLSAGDDFALCANSNLVIVTAGKRQAEGETRLDLANANKKIFAEIIPKIVSAAPDAILLVVTNPVDVLTFHAQKISDLPWQKVFGSGTVLDSARLQFHISEKLKIHPSSIDAYVLGEHGDTSFPVWSSANVLGKPLTQFPNFTQKDADECYEATRTAAYRIINDVGFTCYSIATAVAEIASAIKDDTHRVFPLSVLLQYNYGQSGVCLSVPCVLGKNGIEKIIEIPLSQNEKTALYKSAEAIKKYI